MRLAYLGTPELAVPPLQALVAAGHDVALVVTREDRRRGRGGATSPSPVKAAAADLGLTVSHTVDDVLDVDAELGVVVAFGRLIKDHVLDQLTMINVHFSLLPRWRGAAPVERALLAGDAATGVAIMAVEPALDSGAVYASATVPISDRTTMAKLRAELVEVGTALLIETLSGPLPTPAPQEGEVTIAAKIDSSELRLDWSRPALELDRWVRVGGVWTLWRDRRLKVLAAEPVDAVSGKPGTLVGDGVVAAGRQGLRLLRVQPEGRGPMSWRDFANGAQPQRGERLGEVPATDRRDA